MKEDLQELAISILYGIGPILLLFGSVIGFLYSDIIRIIIIVIVFVVVILFLSLSFGNWLRDVIDNQYNK